MGGTRARRAAGNRWREELRRFALGFPGAHEDFPWGESVVKVGKKVFVFLGRSGGGLGLSVKLPVIRDNYFCRVATISFAGFGRPDGA